MASPLQAPSRIAGFEVLDRIGQGGMGVVYRARQLSIDRIIALKVMHPRLATDRTFAERLLMEAKAAARLAHPNIIQAIDAGEADGYHYFAMEFIDGPTVAGVLEESGRLPEERALDVTIQVTRALVYAHQRHMVHLDIKPSNIMIGPDGTAKLADFGLARRVGDEEEFVTEKKMVFGTPRYMSPEHLSFSVNLDTRSDIYSLGVTLYEMATGVNPFHDKSKIETARKVRHEIAPLVRTLVPELSPEIELVIARMILKDRDERYANPEELLADLEALARGERLPSLGEEQATAPALAALAASIRAIGPRFRKAAPILVVLAVAGILAALYPWVAPRISRSLGPLVSRLLAREREPPSRSPEQEFVAVRGRVRALLSEERFGTAVTLLETFQKDHPEPEWQEKTRQEIIELRGRATAVTKVRVSAAEKALAANEFARARRLADSIAALGLEGSRRQEAALRKTIAAAEAAHQRRLLAGEAKTLVADLGRELAGLQKSGEYRKAASKAGSFLATYGETPAAAGIRGLIAPSERVVRFMDAVLAGARSKRGSRVTGLRRTIVGTRGDAIELADGNGQTRTIPLPEVATDALFVLAATGGMRSRVECHSALAFLMSTAGRHSDAYNAARRAQVLGDASGARHETCSRCSGGSTPIRRATAPIRTTLPSWRATPSAGSMPPKAWLWCRPAPSTI